MRVAAWRAQDGHTRVGCSRLAQISLALKVRSGKKLRQVKTTPSPHLRHLGFRLYLALPCRQLRLSE
jgi:hypothetical protein